jgi:DNA-binding CsgD family transcriptional regulator
MCLENGRLADWARPIVDKFRTYAEISPSREGIKIFGFADEVPDIRVHKIVPAGATNGGRKPEIALFVEKRYFTTTGAQYGGYESVEDVTETLFWLAGWLSQQRPDRETGPESDKSGSESSPWPRTYLSHLWQTGEHVGADKSRSGSDAALACALASAGLHSECAAMLLRAFPHGQPDKADRQIQRLLTLAAKHSARAEESSTEDQPRALPLAEVAPTDVAFLWKERFVIGINIMAGMPDTGKNIFLSTVAACVTTGRSWPDGTRGSAPGRVLISETEDEYANTVVPRLLAAGADMSRCFYLREGTKPQPADMAGFKLFIPSPALSLMSAGKDHMSEIDVRQILGAWKEGCRTHGCAIVAPAHYNKKTDQAALHRILGSQALGALPRSAYCIERDQNDPAVRLFLRLKSNLAPEKRGLRFTIGHTGGPYSQSVVAFFEGETDLRAEDVVGRQPSRLGDTEAKVLGWLRDHPSETGYHYREIAEALEMNESTIRSKLAALVGKNLVERWGSGCCRLTPTR